MFYTVYVKNKKGIPYELILYTDLFIYYVLIFIILSIYNTL